MGRVQLGRKSTVGQIDEYCGTNEARGGDSNAVLRSGRKIKRASLPGDKSNQ